MNLVVFDYVLKFLFKKCTKELQAWGGVFIVFLRHTGQTRDHFIQV